MPGELAKDVSAFESQALSGIVSGTTAVDVGAAVVVGAGVGAAVVVGAGVGAVVVVGAGVGA